MRRALPNPTIKDVARLARVSTATVSNVVSGTGRLSAFFSMPD
jgi:DNA-binding LacI/PurR family transcriptional regulator